MMEGKTKIFISDDVTMFGTSIFITRKNNDGSMDIAEPVQLVFTHYEAKDLEGTAIGMRPTLTLHDMFKNDFLDALYEALKRYGFKPWTESKLEGTLESTNKHLEDLRYLLKLPKAVK